MVHVEIHGSIQQFPQKSEIVPVVSAKEEDAVEYAEPPITVVCPENEPDTNLLMYALGVGIVGVSLWYFSKKRVQYGSPVQAVH